MISWGRSFFIPFSSKVDLDGSGIAEPVGVEGIVAVGVEIYEGGGAVENIRPWCTVVAG